MASARRQLVELSEHLLLQLEPLGDRLDDQPRTVHRLGKVGFSRNPARRNTSEPVRQRGKVLRHIIDSGVLLLFGEVIDPYLSTMCGEHQRDTPSERTGADDGHRPAGEVGWYVETHLLLLVLFCGGQPAETPTDDDHALSPASPVDGVVCGAHAVLPLGSSA